MTVKDKSRNKKIKTETVHKTAIDENNLMYGGLLAIDAILIQDLISLGTIDIPSLIATINLAIAIPLLAAFLVTNHFDSKRKVTAADSVIIATMQFLSIFSSAVGVAASFWHVSWIAGLVAILSEITACMIIIRHLFLLRKLDSLLHKGISDDKAD